MADAADNNPLLADFDFPPFDAVRPAHVRPGIRALLARLEGELVALEKGVEPAWGKLVVPLERIVDRLDVVWNVVDHLKAVKDSADLRAAVEDVQPEKVKFYLRLGQSKPIYEAFNAIWNSRDWGSLGNARQRVVEGQIKDAVLGGVELEDAQREKFNQIQQELEKLAEKFGENVLDATRRFEKLITDKKEINGLPASALSLAAQTAMSKGHKNASAENGPWVITLDALSFLAVMQHATNRDLREEVYRAYLTRASSGDLDNSKVISQILKLRLEKAKLLGYKNYAEVSLARKLATVDEVQVLLEKIRAAAWDHAVEDMEDLKAFVKDSGSAEANDLANWDLNFWSERLRESKYGIDEESLRPYFALPNVMDGLFNLANKLFGINVEPADGLAPVWNSDVRFYCVKDSSNSPVAYFYFDPYSRPSEKRGGAWMNAVFSRSRVLARNGSSVRLPVAHMVCNQMPPVGDTPSLMTFREVETVFHEFGNALQHMLTREDESFIAGISGIELDAVELTSHFMENWCYHKETLLSIAKHYETGEVLPEQIYANLVAAKNFRAGSSGLRQIRLASVDMELHTTYDPSGAVSVYDVDQKVAERTQVLAPLPEDRFLCGFSHIFAGGYAAGYYSYKWAEVLSADAFSAFEDAGLDNEKAIVETGRQFRETVLALGGGQCPLNVFISFRGLRPSPEPLLRHKGLLPMIPYVEDSKTTWSKFFPKLYRLIGVLSDAADILLKVTKILDTVVEQLKHARSSSVQPGTLAARQIVRDINRGINSSRDMVGSLCIQRQDHPNYPGCLTYCKYMLEILFDSRPCDEVVRLFAKATDDRSIQDINAAVQGAIGPLMESRSELRELFWLLKIFQKNLSYPPYETCGQAADNADEGAEVIEKIINKLNELCTFLVNQPPYVRDSLGYHPVHQHKAHRRANFPQEQPHDYSLYNGIGYHWASTTKRIDIPNGMVTIGHLQRLLGASIQVTSDLDVPPSSQTRPVCLAGTVYQINRAEKLINDVLAEGVVTPGPGCYLQKQKSGKRAAVKQEIKATSTWDDSKSLVDDGLEHRDLVDERKQFDEYINCLRERFKEKERIREEEKARKERDREEREKKKGKEKSRKG